MEVFVREITRFKQNFDTELKVFLDNKVKEANTVSKEYGQIASMLSEYILDGGKRLRPFLAYNAYKISGGKNKKEALRLGMALEIFHDYALIHDDIMDESDLRRNQPTFHVRLRRLHRQEKWKGSSTQFGIGMGILAGDILQTWADEAMVSIGNLKVMDVYQEMKNQIMAGQVEDIMLSELQDVPDKKRIVDVMMRKTAGYTAQKPMLMGATLAGGTRRHFEFFNNIAIPLGLAFQLRDDVLGMYGNRKEVGKPTDSDIKEGKVTLLIYYAIQSGKLLRRNILNLLGNKNITRTQIARLKRIIKEHGALDRVRIEIKEFLSKAKNIVSSSKLLNTDQKNVFIGLANFLEKRKH